MTDFLGAIAGEWRTEYAVRIDCEANGCEEPHSDNGRVLPRVSDDEEPLPERVNGHAVSPMQRVVFVSEWVNVV